MTETCYACGTRAGGHRRELAGGFSVATCPECGLEFVLPVPDEGMLERFYEGYTDPRADPRIVGLNARDHLDVLARHGWTPASRMLDFGSGQGIFVREAGAMCFGVELLAASQPRVVRGLDEVDGVFDFVTMWGVLEHLPRPVDTVSTLARRLCGGGCLALTTVDAEGEIPYQHKPPEHLTYWTHDALSVLARRAGLEILEVEPYVMRQLGSVYLERLLARTPPEYAAILARQGVLPDVVVVPTNEVRVIMRRPGAE